MRLSPHLLEGDCYDSTLMPERKDVLRALYIASTLVATLRAFEFALLKTANNQSTAVTGKYYSALGALLENCAYCIPRDAAFSSKSCVCQNLGQGVDHVGGLQAHKSKVLCCAVSCRQMQGGCGDRNLIRISHLPP